MAVHITNISSLVVAHVPNPLFIRQIIKEPMDLSLIRERIMSGALMSLDDMKRDLFVMCTNAMVFNGKDDPYFDYSEVRRMCY